MECRSRKERKEKCDSVVGFGVGLLLCFSVDAATIVALRERV